MKIYSLGLCLLFIACGKSSGQQTGLVKLNPEAIISADQMMKLTTFDSCSTADNYIKSNLKRLLDNDYEMQKKYYLGAEKRFVPVMAEESAAKTTDDGASAPANYTGTNVQVAGVDELDMMKTNGKHIFTLSGNHVQIVKSWPADAMKKISQIDVDGQPFGLFLTEDDKLIVASHPKGNFERPGKDYPWYYGYQAAYYVTNLAVYDVVDPAAPKLLKAYNFRGNYLSMRRQGKNLRLVLANSWSRYPEGIESYVPYYDNNGDKINERDFLKALAETKAKNDAIIETLDFQKWMVEQVRGWGAEWKGVSDDLLDKPNLDCRSIYASEAPGELGLTTVTSLNYESGAIDQAALLANSSEIYSSADSLYLSYNQSWWWWGWDNAAAPKVFIHKFAFGDGVTLSYKGSAAIGGTLNDQFSMDEFEGNLRVAVTDTMNVEASASNDLRPVFNTVNRVLVLKDKEGRLETIGQTKDLAPGERIYSARFAGKKAYVVTFRQTDPLFTLDMSDPTAPKVVGELKVNGFSSYIHLLDDNHLLTVGQDADPETGRTLGLKITVFDVTDPANAKEQFTKTFNDFYTWSEASYDHHAFTYFPQGGYLAIPMTGYRSTNAGNWWDAYFSNLNVFKIDLAQGILDRGAIAMNDLYRAERAEWYDWSYGASVQRSIFADDYVYAISSSGVKAAKTEAISTPVGAVGFYP